MSLTIWEVLGLDEIRKPMKVFKKTTDVASHEYPCYLQQVPEGLPCLLMCHEGVFYLFTLTGKQVPNCRDLITKVKMSTSERQPFIMYCILCDPQDQWDKHLACLDIYGIEQFAEGNIVLPWKQRQSSLSHLIINGFLGYRPAHFYVENGEIWDNMPDFLQVNNNPNFSIGESSLHFKEVIEAS